LAAACVSDVVKKRSTVSSGWITLARSAQDKGALVQRLGAGQFQGLGDELGLPAYRPPYRR
jgi:hypothetical protein